MENGWVGEEKDFVPWRTPAVKKAVLQALFVVLGLSLKILHHWEYSVERGRAGTGINGRGYNQALNHISLRWQMAVAEAGCPLRQDRSE